MIVPFDISGKSRAEILKGYEDMGFDEPTAKAYTSVLLGEDSIDSIDQPVAKETWSMSVASAEKLAKSVGHDEFLAEVKKAAEDGAELLEVSELESGDLMVKALSPKPETTVPFMKSVNEDQRFTLGPMYVPGQYDAHGDWSTPEDLQKAVWDFSRGERTIAVQHHPELGAQGEAVEMMVIPWEHDVPMYKSDGTSETVHFPAGTPWLGVVWNEKTWPVVKSGGIRGYSIGGRASLLDVKLDGQ